MRKGWRFGSCLIVSDSRGLTRIGSLAVQWGSGAGPIYHMRGIYIVATSEIRLKVTIRKMLKYAISTRKLSVDRAETLLVF